MDDPSVQQLILKLKAVRLEESAILAEIERKIAGASAARQLSNKPVENTPISCGDTRCNTTKRDATAYRCKG